MGASGQTQRAAICRGGTVIFVTVGEQLPFNRLVQTVDAWTANSGREVFAQIGETRFRPSRIQYQKFLPLAEFDRKFREAEVIIGHAGMGTIITALEMEKPILVMPRQAALGEHRNDHQFATAKRFLALNFVSVAFDENELLAKLDKLDEIIHVQGNKKAFGPSPQLIKTIRDFIESS